MVARIREQVEATGTALPACARAAAWYARHGLRCHPLRPGTKLPLLSEWQRRAATDTATINEWWMGWPDAGVAIATGTESGVIVVDVDPRHGGDHSLADLERQYGKLSPSWRCLTAGGGLHLYYKHPAVVCGNRAGLWPGIDLRGDGGYVVAPPTALDVGRGYAWEIGHGPHELALAAAPHWLFDHDGGDRLRRDGAPLRLTAGSRNTTLFRIAAALRRYGVAAPAIAGALAAINKDHSTPPLDARELERIAASASRYAPALSTARSDDFETLVVRELGP